MAGYRIEDEPEGSALAEWVTGPVFALFAVMFAGPWLAWPWAVFNSFAMGSHRRWGDLALGVAGLVSSTILVFTILVLTAAEVLPEQALPYALVAVTTLKLGVSYWLYMRQVSSHQLHVYYRGRSRNGLIVVGAGFLVRTVLPSSVFLLPVI